jgi:hypothetical protein
MNNSFSISRRGARDKVKAALKNEVAKPDGSPQRQIKAAVAYLLTQIDALPAEFNAVEVTANGDLLEHRAVLHSAVVQGVKMDL